MIKKLTCLCLFIAALISAAWAGSYNLCVYSIYGDSPHFWYGPADFGVGTVFTATVSGYGPGNGVSFAYDANSNPNNYFVFVGPGTQSSESFYATQTSSALSGYTQCIVGVSATANGAGSYCTSTLSATW